MGQQRFTGLPRTAKWRRLFEQLVTGEGLASEDVRRLAALTVEAAATGFQRAEEDEGLRYTFYVLTEMGLAGQQPDWRSYLSGIGVQVADDPCPLDLTAGIQAAIDDHISAEAHPTDLGEIAQEAAGEALITFAAVDASILRRGRGELDHLMRRIASPTGFARLGQLFFGLLTARFINFYLSRISADQVGTDRIPTIADLSRLNDALRGHCEKSASGAADDCRQWFVEAGWAEHPIQKAAGKLLSDALTGIRDVLLSEEAAE